MSRSEKFEALRQAPQSPAKASIGVKVLTRRKRLCYDPRYHALRHDSKKHKLRRR